MKDCNVNSAFLLPSLLRASCLFFACFFFGRRSFPAALPGKLSSVYIIITRVIGLPRCVPAKRIKFVKLAVSFYGASYIHLPVQEAKGATDISFRFRTHLADAMLLLAAGKTDYCLIKLEAGRLKVRLPPALTSINRISVWCPVVARRR